MQRTCLCAHLLRTLTLKCKGAAEIHHRAGAIDASSSSFTGLGSRDRSGRTLRANVRQSQTPDYSDRTRQWSDQSVTRCAEKAHFWF